MGPNLCRLQRITQVNGLAQEKRMGWSAQITQESDIPDDCVDHANFGDIVVLSDKKPKCCYEIGIPNGKTRRAEIGGRIGCFNGNAPLI
ncbi:hypothetical protein D3C85_1503920 [compost metagenome]